MTVSVLSAAKRLASQSDWTLSNLELQKILYLAHMFFLGRTGGKPLVFGNFEAWNYGPVHPQLYHVAKIFGSEPVKDVFGDTHEPHESPERAIIDEAYSSLGHVAPGALVSATHRRGGAWESNYIPGVPHIIIPNDDILKEYQEIPDAS